MLYPGEATAETAETQQAPEEKGYRRIFPMSPWRDPTPIADSQIGLTQIVRVAELQLRDDGASWRFTVAVAQIKAGSVSIPNRVANQI